VRENLSSILVAVLLSYLVFISGCNNVGAGSNGSNPNMNSGPQPPAGSPAPVQSVLTDCGTIISSPGTYSLNSSLETNSSPEACVTITGTDNVTLNCNGNSITGVGEYGIGALNVNSLIIENCMVATGTGDGFSTLLGLNNVKGATVTGSTFGSRLNNFGGVLISDSTNITFGSRLPSAPANPSVTAITNPVISSQLSNAPPASNTLYGFLDASNNINLVIEGTAMTSGTRSELNSFMIGIFGGQNTHVANNTVNGLGSPIPIEENGVYYINGAGSDDDILVEDETGPGSLISGNILVNTFDCGIETVGFMRDITLYSNYIDTVAIGMGGWYYVSVTNAQYAQNVMTNIEYSGFRYIRFGGLRPAGGQNLPYLSYIIPADMPAETTINFNQNQFSGNTLAQPIGFLGERVGSVEVPVYSSMAYIAMSTLPGTDPTPQQFITVNNAFASNIFDKAFYPLLFSSGEDWSYTSNDVIDGKGNICSGSQNYVPPVSPTFGHPTDAVVLFSPIICGS